MKRDTEYCDMRCESACVQDALGYALSLARFSYSDWLRERVHKNRGAKHEKCTVHFLVKIGCAPAQVVQLVALYQRCIIEDGNGK